MAIEQVAVSHKTENRRMPRETFKARVFWHTPDETPPYFGGINCIKDNVEIDPPYNTGNDFIYRDDFAMSGEEIQRGIRAGGRGNRRMFVPQY